MNSLLEFNNTNITSESSENVVTKEAEANQKYINIDEFKIFFLPLNQMQEFVSKSKFNNFFDAAFFSNTGAASMNKELTKILKSNALVVFETAKFMLEMSNDQMSSFTTRLNQISSESGLVRLGSENGQTNKAEATKIEQNNFLTFKFERIK